MTLKDQIRLVGRMEDCTILYPTGISAKPHGAAFEVDFLLLRHEVDHLVSGIRRKLSGIRILKAQLGAGKPDGQDLHAETDPKDGNPHLFSCSGRKHHALNPPFPEASGDEDSVHVFEALQYIFRR